VDLEALVSAAALRLAAGKCDVDLAGATVGRNELVDREALPYRFDATERPEQRGQTSLCDAEDLDVDIF